MSQSADTPKKSAIAKTHYDTLIKIADFYDVSVDWLMGRTDKREVNR